MPKRVLSYKRAPKKIISDAKREEQTRSEYGRLLVGTHSKDYINEGLVRSDEKRKEGDLYGSIDMLNLTYKNVIKTNNLDNNDKLAYLGRVQARTYRVIRQAKSSHREDVINSAKELSDKVNKSGIEIGRKTPINLKKLKDIAATTSIIGLLGGLFFLSSNMTGKVIGNMTNSTSNWIGGILFFIGLIGAFTYFRKR